MTKSVLNRQRTDPQRTREPESSGGTWAPYQLAIKIGFSGGWALVADSTE
jgi:hypothetical protein